DLAGQYEHDRLLQKLSCRLLWTQNAALAHGLDLRLPYYDLRVVEFLLSIPAASKVDRGNPKSIVRHALRGRLPDQLRLFHDDDRGSYHPVLDRGLQILLRDGMGWLRDGRLVDLGYVDRAGLDRLIAAYAGGDVSRRHALGRVVQLEFWLRS